MRSFYNNVESRTTDTQWRHKSKESENLGQCGRQNMLWAYLNTWDWDLIFDHAVKAISSPGVRSPWGKARYNSPVISLCAFRNFGIVHEMTWNPYYFIENSWYVFVLFIIFRPTQTKSLRFWILISNRKSKSNILLVCFLTNFFRKIRQSR